jgi:hypothetical protein
MHNTNFPNFSTSFLRFIEANIKGSKICRIIYASIYKRYRDSGNIFTTENLNYITNRKDGNISYLPKGKPHLVNEETNEWKKEGRQDGKPAKVIRKIFTDKFIKRSLKDSDFEQFANLYKSTFLEQGYYLKLLPNTKIKDIYCHSINEDLGGSLQGSCMNGDRNFLDIYEHCEKLQILCLFSENDNYLHGRCLVWDISENFNEGEKVFLMDRFYVSNDFQYQYFIQYAIDNKFWYKKDYKTYANKDSFIRHDEEGEMYNIFKALTIKTKCSFDKYPYIDTFSFGDDYSLNNCHEGIYSYNCTDGSRDGDDSFNEDNDEDRVECQYSGNDYHVDDCTYVDYYRNIDLQYSDCFIADRYTVDAWLPNINYAVLVCMHDNNIVEVDGTYYHVEHCDICEVDGDYYLVDDCVFCEDDNEWVLTEDATEIKGIWFKTENCIEIDGEWFYKYDEDNIVAFIVDREYKYFHVNDARLFRDVDGRIFLKNSEAYRNYRDFKRRERKRRRNKLGRKNRSKKVSK